MHPWVNDLPSERHTKNVYPRGSPDREGEAEPTEEGFPGAVQDVAGVGMSWPGSVSELGTPVWWQSHTNVPRALLTVVDGHHLLWGQVSQGSCGGIGAVQAGFPTLCSRGFLSQ